jgi:uncharacterized protein
MKKVFKLLIVFIFCICLNVNAGTDTFDRESLPNYGVNKNWEINSSNLNKVLNTYAVDASEKIYDFSNILTADEEKELKTLIDKFVKKHHTDVIILTDDLRYMSDYENEEFVADFFDYNDFGMDYNNSGIVFFRNTYTNDPYYNIYSFGDAQLYMSYDRVEATLNHIYDYLHNKNYLEGFTKYINDLDLYYGEGIPKTMKDYEVDENGYLKKKYTIPWFQAIGISLVLTILIMFILVKQNKMVVKATKANQYINHKESKINNRKDVFLTSATRTYTINTNNGSSGGPSSTRGSSGGGHSSGSGRHG